MPQPFTQGNQIKKRTSVLVFLKGTTAPLVLYVENPLELYEELLQVLRLNSLKKILLALLKESAFNQLQYAQLLCKMNSICSLFHIN